MRPSLLPSSISAAFVAAASAAVLADAAEIMSNEELATYALTLTEFNAIRSTESPNDFGGISGGDQDQLWTDAAVFEYEVATSHSDDMAETSAGYHPYLVCSTHPNMTGDAREDAVRAIFESTPDVSATHYYNSPNLFHNKDDMSCGAMRAYDDTMGKVFAASSDARDNLRVNPMHSSMKMVENTVEVLDTWFKGGDAGDVVSVGAERNSNRIQVKVMGLKMILCPGVQNFKVTDVVDDEIAEDVVDFITGDGGKKVSDASFYHHRASGMDGDTALLTDRMKQWSAAVTEVLSWTKDDGSNSCLDTIIRDNMIFTVHNLTLDVHAKLSFKEAEILSEELGFEEEDLETCIWYMTYALGVSPQVCSVQTETGVKTLCADGTSDLSKCPPESSGSWMNGVFGAMISLLVSSFFGAVIVS